MTLDLTEAEYTIILRSLYRESHFLLDILQDFMNSECRTEVRFRYHDTEELRAKIHTLHGETLDD